MLDIPELLSVVKDWDSEIRAVLPANGFWFAPISPVTGALDPTITSIGEHREKIARRNIKACLSQVGLPYHSPHKFRHGHIHYGNSHAKTVEDFKAVSMNAMHSSLRITDEFYSNLGDEAVRTRIASLGIVAGQDNDDSEELRLFAEFLKWKQSLKGPNA